MTLQQLRYVVEIAREGSMSRAARNLLISQPSLSASIARLEEELAEVRKQRNEQHRPQQQRCNGSERRSFLPLARYSQKRYDRQKRRRSSSKRRPSIGTIQFGMYILLHIVYFTPI